VYIFWMDISHPAGSFPYPSSRKSDQVDDLHGHRIADPYRWLEDLDSSETSAWVKAQNHVTFGFLDAIPARDRIRERLTKLWNFERFGAPFRKGGRYFYFKNDGLQNQSVLYTLAPLTSAPRVLFDPNTLSKDGTVSLTVLSVSEDGKYLAYGVSTSGSDWEIWKFRNIETAVDLPDQLERIKFASPVWAKDGSGIYYGRYDGDLNKLEDINRFQKLYFHRLGEKQEKDELIYDRPDQEEWGFSADLSENGNILFIVVWKGTDPMNLVFWKDLGKRDGMVHELVSDFRAKYTPIADDGKTFWFLTDWNAPRGRIVGMPLEKIDPAGWVEVVPQSEDTLEDVSVVGNRLVAGYLHHAHAVVRAFDLNGNPLGEIPLPGLGTAGGFSGERMDMETFYTYTSFTFPATVYRLDFTTGQSTVFRKPVLDFDASEYATHQIFAPSKDGTAIPVFLIYRRGLKLDGNNPTYLYGYGGFGISLTPSFSIGNLPWLELGGVLAIANIRGGGEYGEEWHQAGAKSSKQNCFDDFIAVAEWLIKEKYTQPRRLAIGGGSNGGLLVAACLVQRPELFGAVLPAVGVMDMLRFHRFTIGWAWVSDYGNPDNAEEFQTLLAYSPLHNLKKGTVYPATMITTADHDDRVVPSHSFKFAASLQAAVDGAPMANSARPMLIRIETKAGHGAGKPTTKVIEEISDRWAFLVKVLGIEV
jgi:prolyl oligopeptidase